MSTITSPALFTPATRPAAQSQGRYLISQALLADRRLFRNAAPSNSCPSAHLSSSRIRILHELEPFSPLQPKRSRQVSASSGSASEGEDNVIRQAPRRPGVPRSIDDSIDEAIGAIKKAIIDGQNLQLIQLVLPLIAPSLLDDWPGGIQQQAQAATPLVSKILRGLNNVNSDSGFKKSMLSDEDSVLQWETPRGNLVLFPMAETLPTLRQLAASNLPLLIVNPQWQPGQVVSDFGFGQKRKEAEDFLNSFVPSYSLNTTRIGGANVTVVRSYPSEWCVYTEDEGTRSFKFAGSLPEKPTYRQIEALVKSAEASSPGGKLGLFDRLAKEFKFLKDSK